MAVILLLRLSNSKQQVCVEVSWLLLSCILPAAHCALPLLCHDAHFCSLEPLGRLGRNVDACVAASFTASVSVTQRATTSCGFAPNSSYLPPPPPSPPPPFSPLPVLCSEGGNSFYSLNRLKLADAGHLLDVSQTSTIPSGYMVHLRRWVISSGPEHSIFMHARQPPLGP